MPSPSGSTQRYSRPRQRTKRSNTELIGLRYNAGLSREMLGYKAGVGRETIRMAEAGHVPTPRIQFAIAKALSKALDEHIEVLTIWPVEVSVAAMKRRPQPEAEAAR